ncbi:MAG: hypothetical protein D8M53_06070 [Armatimonadetes bacterium]|nr:hypothetical protein [Armatimonadota bacterium]
MSFLGVSRRDSDYHAPLLHTLTYVSPEGAFFHFCDLAEGVLGLHRDGLHLRAPLPAPSGLLETDGLAPRPPRRGEEGTDFARACFAPP